MQRPGVPFSLPLPLRRRLAATAAALLLVTFAAGCTGSSDQAGSHPDAPGAIRYDAATQGPLFAAFPPRDPPQPLPPGITLNPDTVLLPGGIGSVRGISDDHLHWSLAADAPGVADLAPGKVMLLAGIEAGRVTAANRHDDQTDVTIEPVGFTDVVQTGHLRWDHVALDPAKAFTFRAPRRGDTDAAPGPGGTTPGTATPGDATTSTTSTTSTTAPHGLAAPHAARFLSATAAAEGDEQGCTEGPDLPQATFPGDQTKDETGTTDAGQANGGTEPAPSPWKLSFELDGYSVEVDPAMPGNHVLTVDFTVTKCPKTQVAGAGIELQMTLKGKLVLRGLEFDGDLDIKDGKAQSGHLHVPMQGSLDLELVSGTEEHGGQFPVKVLLDFPFGIDFPLLFGPIPGYLSIGEAVSLQPSFATKPSALDARTHLDFSGSQGFTISNGEVKPEQTQTTFQEPDSPLGSTRVTPSIGTIAFVAAAQLPRIGLGVGSVWVLEAKLGIWTDLVVALGGTWAGSTSLIPCSTMNLSAAAHGGVEAGLGLKLGPFEIKIAGSDSISKFTLFSKSKSWWRPDIKACQV